MIEPAKLQFEPHLMYGHVIDDETMPFGYLSCGAGQPLFELSPVLETDAAKLTTAISGIVHAANHYPKAIEALRALCDLAEGFVPLCDENSKLAKAIEAARAILSQAEGPQE